MTFSIEKLIRPNIATMKSYRSARDEFSTTDQKMIFLDANENPYNNGLNRYPDPHQHKLKLAVSKQRGCKESQLMLGNGSDEVLDLIFRAFCEPGVDNVITLPPTYGMYNVLANLNNITNIQVTLTADFNPDVEAILASIQSNTKVIFLCSPNNPTGNSFSELDIEKILIQFGGLVVIDEAYIDFSSKESWLKRLEEFPNLIITQTFSKAYGMAGIRLGMCFASELIIAVLKKIKPPYNVNALTQIKALERLNNKNLIKFEIDSIIDNKSILTNLLLELKFIEHISVSDANFLLVKVDDANLRYQQFMKLGIVVRNRTNEPLCENTLRITIGSIEENTQLIKALKTIEA